MKIAVLGYSGSGKSTLAKYLGSLFQIPVLYLDTVQFEPSWKVRDRDAACEMVRTFMAQENWVIDGNYRGFYQQERLDAADHIVFLEFSRWNCLWRAYRRYFQYRNTTRESMAEGCCEKIDLEFVWWILYKGRSKQAIRHNRDMICRYQDKTVVLKNQRQLTAFMRRPFAT